MLRFTTSARNSLSDAVIGLKRITVLGGAEHSLFLKIIGFGTFSLGSMDFLEGSSNGGLPCVF